MSGGERGDRRQGMESLSAETSEVTVTASLQRTNGLVLAVRNAAVVTSICAADGSQAILLPLCPDSLKNHIVAVGALSRPVLSERTRSQAVETLVGAEVFIGLTGTLIQNELAEFWWLMNMIQNGVLKTDAEFMV